MITVIRLGERPERDHRINTHLALVARAFGAQKLIMFFKDQSLLDSVSGVNKRFGGTFSVDFWERIAWKQFLRDHRGILVHLTMYGIPLDEGIDRLKTHEHNRDIYIILGGEKVPADVYQKADLNIAVGNQPHSEVAALAIFLDRYYQGRELNREMENWKQQIIPQERGKKVQER